MGRVFDKLLNWYFSKNSLPYWCVLLADSAICYISGIIVFWFYYRGAVTLGNIGLLSKTIAIYMVFNLIGFRVFRTYSGILRYSSFVDLQRVALAQLLSCAIAEVVHYIIFQVSMQFVRLQGRQILLMYILATILMWTMRVLVKALYDISLNSINRKGALVYGIQEGGVAIAKNMRSDRSWRYIFEGFISPEPLTSRHTLMGKKVYNPDANIVQTITEKGIKAVVVSPLQREKFRKDTELQEMLIDNGVQIYMMPDLQEWKTDGNLTVNNFKEINIEDLLPRSEIKVDMDAIGEMLNDSTVLITGSAGSIGSEMVRQIAVFRPRKMILIDSAETPQHNIRLMMRERFPDVECNVIVVSIVQQDRMEHIFSTAKPDYVFHAAAYKHVPMMEDNPSEAIYNNVLGTKIIADLSVKYGVKRFVMISTDKAVNPTNVMGCSKRLCEMYCQSLNSHQETTQFITTRFGNVLGSNGSVIPIFEKQIKSGGPVTVTDPNIIRFFMLIPEACRLVLEAGTHGKGGSIMVFDMGKPVKIASLARRMIKLSGAKGVEIKYTGLRQGEKLYEELLSDKESTLPSENEKIRIAKVEPRDYETVARQIEELFEISHSFDSMAIVSKMKEIVPEYAPNNTCWDVLNTK